MTTTDSPPLARSTVALLTDRTFGPYFFGNLASNIGTWFQQVTAAVVVFELTGSALVVGLVAVLQFLPSLLLAPWSGAAADRFDRRRLLLVAQTPAALAAAALAATTLTVGLDDFPYAWPVLAAAAVIGLAQAFSVPAMQALVPGLVPEADLAQAVALNSVTFNLARAVGPALGAVTLVALGPGVAFSVNAASYLALIAALSVIRSRPVARPARASVWGGFRHLRADPVMGALLVGVAALGFGADPVITLAPALADGLLGPAGTAAGRGALVGGLVSMFGVGAVLAMLAVPASRDRLGHRGTAIAGLCVLAAGMISVALAPSPPWAMGAMAIGGFGFLLAVTALTSLMHLRINEQIRGRMMALWGIAFLGSRPLAAFLDGLVADAFSPELAAAVAAAVVLGCGLVVARFVPRGAQ
jgi:MFS family permease